MKVGIQDVQMLYQLPKKRRKAANANKSLYIFRSPGARGMFSLKLLPGAGLMGCLLIEFQTIDALTRHLNIIPPHRRRSMPVV